MDRGAGKGVSSHPAYVRKILQAMKTYGLIAAGHYGGPAVFAGGERVVTAAGRCGVPASAKAVSLNATAVTPPAAGNTRRLAAVDPGWGNA